MKISKKNLSSIINNALSEDIGSGDITTGAVISKDKPAQGVIRAKQEGVVFGHEAAREVYNQLDAKAKYTAKARDGARVGKGEVIAEISAGMKTILSGERVALDFLMHLSGIATLTNRFVSAVDGINVKILDTRKTIPGLRLLEKAAVKAGGGENHRIGLFDMFLIKDNHIEAAGSISKAIESCLQWRGRKKLKIEVETKSIEEIQEALKYKIDRIMLDNMSLDQMKKAVEYIRSKNSDVEIEASGNVSLGSVRRIANTGVDYISIGKLTHSAPALDLSMEIVPL
ncbi:MAG TPA: carboxylating nicotinate-nucleotide diphosphorylase [candidate division Zixibacteria bacterium]|nr:carboxylating nicotinate-nucleotide diphosphorylase [candidate division Zixibacteria bacterium]